jgi:hypothetical protein
MEKSVPEDQITEMWIGSYDVLLTTQTSLKLARIGSYRF